MHRWIARLLVVVMLFPAFGPMAMARMSPSMGPHCQRQPSQPVMHCHDGMSMAAPATSSDASFRASDCCCQDHCCCRGIATLRWAKVEGRLAEHVSLSAEAVAPALGSQFVLATRTDRDSARAPPRS